jgi:mannose-1-phosphate guanylyltransferase
MPRENIIVQPENRGTAHGLLLPLLHIAQRDPDAKLLVLPADHHVRDELTLAKAMQQALDSLQSCDRRVILLGLQPEQCDPDLGYILPGRTDAHGIAGIVRFVEKPTAIYARQLINCGGLWNAFIMASTASTLLELFERRMGSTVKAMKQALQRDLPTPGSTSLLAEIYRHLQTVDLSRDILQGEESLLGVLRVGQCGWSDLGTPERVARVLGRSSIRNGNEVLRAVSGRLNLASQHARIYGERLETAPAAKGGASRARAG